MGGPGRGGGILKGKEPGPNLGPAGGGGPGAQSGPWSSETWLQVTPTKSSEQFPIYNKGNLSLILTGSQLLSVRVQSLPSPSIGFQKRFIDMLNFWKGAKKKQCQWMLAVPFSWRKINSVINFCRHTKKNKKFQESKVDAEQW